MPKFNTTGPAEDNDEKEVQSMADTEVASQVLPGTNPWTNECVP